MQSNKNNLPMPSLNVNIPVTQPQSEEKPLISEEKVKSYYEEAIENIREDRKEANEMYLKFADMVMNEDGSAATKEALVNFLKIKTEQSDKMIKILDLWTRIHMKEKNTFPKYLSVQQNNKIDAKPNRKTMEALMNKVNEVEINES
jgi:hypothetical protein